MKTTLTVPLLTAWLLACLAPAQPQLRAIKSNNPAAEYTIYAAVIGHMFAGGKVSFDSQAKVKLLVIADRTSSGHFLEIAADAVWQNLRRQFPSLSQETVDDFAEKNARPHRLRRRFNVTMNYALTPRAEIEQIFKYGGGWWAEFYRRFPDSGGYIGLSRVGFNVGGDQALVYLEHVCGGLCGSGYYLLLAKSKSGWEVRDKIRIWIS